MKIIIAGAGEVGFYLAQLFEQRYQDISVIDINQGELKQVEKHLGIDTIPGDSTSYKTLRRAGVENADLLIAVTSEESVNIVTCLIAKKLGAKATIARINKMEYLTDKESLDIKDLGIDDLISPESLAAREIKHILKSPALTERIDLENGELSIMSLSLSKKSQLLGKSIVQMSHLIPEQSFMIVAIQRLGETIIPSGSTVFCEGDQIYFLSKP